MPDYPPGYGGPQAPGIFGSTAMGLGMGAQYGVQGQQAQLGMQMGAVQAGAAPVNALANWAWPVGVQAFTMGAFTVAPMMQKGATSQLGRGVGRAWGMADPFKWAGVTGKPAMAFGKGAMGLSGTGFFGTMSSTMGGAVSAGSARAGFSGAVRGGIGAAARIGGAGAIGAAGALPPLALGMLATEAIMGLGEKVHQGAQMGMQGETLMAQMGQSIAPGQQISRDSSSGVGRMMNDLGADIGKTGEEMGQMAQEMNRQGLFKTTSSVKEFRTRFKEVLSTVKEISSTLQTTVDDAMKTFGELRQQGFYTTSDIKSQAVKDKSREMASGVSHGQMQAVGQYGAQAARSVGLRGRVGSDLFKQSQAGVAQALRSGAMSEEDVEEMGGSSQVAARLATRQMRFMKSSRGRAMIAYSMGEGGAPDSERLGRMLSGDMSMEGLVTGAAGRGMGTLGAAGGAKAQEQFAQYSQMAMISMAAMQSKQLSGSANPAQITRMLGTMGVGKDEARLMMQQAGNRSTAMQEQREAAGFAAQQSAQEERLGRPGGFSQLYGMMGQAINRPLEDAGMGLRDSSSDAYEGAMRWATGRGKVRTIGQEDYAATRRAQQRGASLDGGDDLGGYAADAMRTQAFQFTFGDEEAGRRRSSGETVRNLGDGRHATDAGISGARRGARGFRDEINGVAQSAGGGITGTSRALIEQELRGKGVASGRGSTAFQLQALHAGREITKTTRSVGKHLGLSSVFDRGLAAIDKNDERRQTEQEYEAAKEWEMLSGVSKEDYLADTDDAKVRQQAVRSEIAKNTGIGAGVEDVMGSMNTDVIRDKLEDRLTLSISKGVGRSFFDFGSGDRKSAKLTEAIMGDSKKRAAYNEYMRVLEESPTDTMALNTALNKAKKTLGPDTQAFEALDDLNHAYRNDKDLRDEAIASHRDNKGMMDRESAVHTLGRQFAMERKQIANYKQGLVDGQADNLSPAQKVLVDNLETAVGSSVSDETQQARQNAWHSIYSSALSSKGADGATVTKEEAELMGIGGGAGGVGLGAQMEAAVKSGGDTRRARLSKLGVADADITGLMKGMRKGDAGEVLSKHMLDNNIIDPLGEGSKGGKGTKTIAGEMAEFAKYNLAFVQAVERFASGAGFEIPESKED